MREEMQNDSPETPPRAEGAGQEASEQTAQPLPPKPAEAASPAESQEKDNRSSPERVLAIVLGSIAGLLVLLVLAAGAFLLYSGRLHGSMFAERSSEGMRQLREQQAAEASPSPTPILPDLDADWIDSEGRAYRHRENVVTVLLMGVDYMWKSWHWYPGTSSNSGNADLLALAVLDLDTNELELLYIPRDTMADVMVVDTQGNYEDTIYTNISTAHSYGDGAELSCELTVHAVSNLLCGARIDRYAAVNTDAVNVINNLLGGVEITLDQDYTEIDWSLREGSTVRLSNWMRQRMISYRDKRDIDGAYKRGLRDLKILRAMADQLVKMLKDDPSVLLRMVQALDGYLSTNLSTDEISFLAQRVMKIAPDGYSMASLEGENRAGEKYVEFYPDEQWLHDYAARTLYVPAA